MRRLSVSEAAFVLSVSDSTVRRRIKHGELRALRELVGGRTRTWVILEPVEDLEDVSLVETVQALESVEQPQTDFASPAPTLISAVRPAPPVAVASAPAEPTEQVEPLVFERPEPGQSWLTGWALRTPRTQEWVAPSGAGEPVLTLRLSDARVHRTEELARTYASWLPIEVEPMPVAVGA